MFKNKTIYAVAELNSVLLSLRYFCQRLPQIAKAFSAEEMKFLSFLGRKKLASFSYPRRKYMGREDSQ